MTREQYIAQFYESTDRDFTTENLYGVDLSNCRWAHCDFTGANLGETDLTNAGGAGACFVNANLSGSVATRCDFTRCDLRGTSLQAAAVTDWSGAILRCADLRGVAFGSVVLLVDADLSGALRMADDDELDGWEMVSDWATVRERDIAWQRLQRGCDEDTLVARQWTRLPDVPPLVFADADVRWLARPEL